MQVYQLVLIGQNFELWPINGEVLKSQDWIVFISTVQPELTCYFWTIVIAVQLSSTSLKTGCLIPDHVHGCEADQ